MNPLSNAINDSTLKKLKELYSMTSYMDKYGRDVWISAILSVVFIYLTCHQYLMNVVEAVRADWPNQRCNPFFMPFAGFINKPKDQSNLEFTAENFSGCITSILEFIAMVAFQPFRIILQVLNQAIQYLVDSFNKFRALLDKLRREYASIFDQIFGGISNLMVAFISFMVKMKDTMEKTKGVLTGVLFTIFGAYMAMESLFLAMLDLIVFILICIAAVIIIFLYVSGVLFPIPIIGQAMAWPSIIGAIITAIVMIAILIPVLWFMIMMMRVLSLSSPPPPKVPGCFAATTLIPLFEPGKEKYIKDIRIGDKLRDGGTVTATIKFAAEKQNIYHLAEVQVTGEHRVFHPILKWIKVKNHPESIYLPDFNEPFVYCLNTDTKVFVIADTLFSDWDDIDTKVEADLKENCDYLPENFTCKDIHTYTDSGFHADTEVTLNNGLVIPIHEVKVNDVLENNTKVLGVIQIQGKDIELYRHSLINDAFICGSKNIHIADSNLGIVQSECIRSTSILYHLLTDSKFYMANNICVHDYNYGIDVYLS
jgi:hypothetical protein